MPNFRYIVFFLLCGLTSHTYGQLTNFNLAVSPSNETCTNNGKLEMTVSNTTPNAEITYKLFLAPDYTNTVAETLDNSFSSLPAGNYRVVATQILNGQSNSQQVDAVIQDLVELLEFQLTDSSASDCDTTASIIVQVMSGNPTLYEIISGPELRPLQNSNIFENLATGTYIIRVFDDCNDASTKAYTLILGNNDLEIGAPEYSNTNPSCDFLEIKNSITSTTGALILYPLTVQYTIFAPDGTVAQNFTQIISSGPADVLELFQNIELFGGQLFAINIQVTDNCNNAFVEGFIIDPNPKLNVNPQKGDCGAMYFNLTAQNFRPPFTLNFIEPLGFNPSLYNATYPGPYAIDEIIFGSSENTPPFGNYKVQIQDFCGRTSVFEFSMVKKELKPITSASNNGCGSSFGKVKIQIPEQRKIVSISILQAPEAYLQTLPSDVTAFVDSYGVYLQTDLPVGEYIFFFTDNCGDTYTKIVKVPAFVFGQLITVVRPDCSPTSGAVKLSTSNGILVTMKITAAPQAFTYTLPYDVSFNINSTGVFYMSNLPGGNYTFSAIDICGFDLQKNVDIIGYTSNSDGFQLTRKCGSFDITMNDTDNSITNKSFWLQKYYPETNSWGHPNTGAFATDDSVPNSTTAIELINFETVLNLFVLGDFRVIKVFDSFNNGNPNAKCTDEYVKFTISPELIISGVYNLSCNDGLGPNNVVIDAVGVAPFNFKITSPIVLDNGENNLFTNLPEGIYNLQVTDFCGSIKNIPVEAGTLLPLARAFKPKSMLICRDNGVQFGVFPLINQTQEILGNQNPNNYNVTYHLSQNEADQAINSLPDGFTNTSNPQTIFARVEHKIIKLCYATTSFAIYAGVIPVLEPVDPVLICDGVAKKLTADSGFDAYEWSTGETTQSIFVTTSDTYTVTVKNVYEDFSCSTSKDFIVNSSSIASIQSIETVDWSSNNNTLVVTVRGGGVYLYSVDNFNFQTSNTFTNLVPGIYTVYIKDKKGCGTAKKEFVLLHYPNYFTPNDDGYNDTWHIKFADYEANLNVDIFDRFGKFITRLKGGESGWDGTYNGQKLPATDYWFVVIRENGTVYRGHFSLKR